VFNICLVLTYLQLGESNDVLTITCFVFFHDSIKTAILANHKNISNAKSNNCIFFVNFQRWIYKIILNKPNKYFSNFDNG